MNKTLDDLIEVVSTNGQFLREAANTLRTGEGVVDSVFYVETLATAVLEAVTDFLGENGDNTEDDRYSEGFDDGWEGGYVIGYDEGLDAAISEQADIPPLKSVDSQN